MNPSTQTHLSAGQMVTQNLRLVRPIGRGGMGTVWVAYHQTLGTEVAVKCIDPLVVKSNPTALKRFHREAGIAARLKNPHVAHTYDHGMLPDGTPYIVMELLEGESLQQRIQRLGKLSLHETSLVVSQTAQALGKAHKLGIVHRDVKPANLFCVESDYDVFIKLLDFGIAKHGDNMAEVELTTTAGMLGSPLYMSPEQFNSAKGVDVRADLWSLAVVAYQCLTGRPPFAGEALAQVILSVMDRKYTAVSSRLPHLPRELDAWFERSFHRSLMRRFQSAKELGVSFAAIAREAAVNSDQRPAIPSITETPGRSMSQSGDHPMRGNTADLPAAGTPSSPRGTAILPVVGAITSPTLESPGDYSSVSTAQTAMLEPGWMPTQVISDSQNPVAGTFAPSITAVGRANKRRRVQLLGGIAAGASCLLVGAFIAVSVATGDETAVSISPATTAQVSDEDDGHVAETAPASDEDADEDADLVTAAADSTAVASAEAAPSGSTSASSAATTPPPRYPGSWRPPRPPPPPIRPRPRPDLDGAGF